MERGQQAIPISQIPKFEFEINNDELRSCIKELSFQIKTIEKNLTKVKKDVDIRPTESSITEALIMINGGIEIEPNLVKLLKTREARKDENNPLRNSALTLSTKINQISQCLPILLTTVKNLEKRMNTFEGDLKSTINEKTNTLQEQLNEFKTDQMNQNLSLQQKIEVSFGEYGNKLREVQTKTVWQINDCKTRLEDRVNQQFVRDAIKETEGKLSTKIKETVMKGNIDPDRITKIENKISKNEKEIFNQLTETNFKLTALKEHMEGTSLTKKSYGQERLEIEKRFSVLNNNFSDLYRRTKSNETVAGQNRQSIIQIKENEESTSKELKRINGVLQNLKIGDDFQKMLQKMDPHKICELDNSIQSLQLNEVKTNKELDLLKRQVDHLRSKNEFVGMITPNQQKVGRVDKDQISSLISEFFVNNQFARKIQNLEAQLLQTKTYNEMINELNKRVARLQKQSEYQNVIYELRGLEEYIKKEVLIMTNRCNQLETKISDDRKKRPMSAQRTLGSESKLASTVSYKKLVPVNCISCYPNTTISSDRKSSLFKKL